VADVSGSDGSGGGGTLLIGVAVSVVLVLFAAGVVIARLRRKPDVPPRELWTENNPTFNKENSMMSDGPIRAGYLDVNSELDGFDFPFNGAAAMHSTTTSARRSPSVGADAERLPEAWQSLSAVFFKREEFFPNVLLSYQSDSTGKKGSGVGKAWMWAMANGFRAANITSFNGYQVGPSLPFAIFQ
jgi:hypothetical protein